MSLQLTGLIAAPFTPFNSDGSLNLNLVEPYARHLQRTGVQGAFVAGTTGEGPSLQIREREALAGRWVEAGREAGLKIIVQVGHSCQADACSLAADAVRIGADAVGAHAPAFLKPPSVRHLIDFLAPIAEAAEPLPFYFYELPSQTSVHLSMVELLTHARERIPTFHGLKYSNTDLVQLQQCLALEGPFDILFGIDELLLAAMALGVKGAIGATYNFAAPLYVRLMRAFEGGDIDAARQAARRSVEMVRVLARAGFIPASKSLMSRFGLDCGPVRPPLLSLAPHEAEELHARLGFDW